MPTPKGDIFPHACKTLQPEGRFIIGHRWLELYSTFTSNEISYCLYWNNDVSPVRFGMNLKAALKKIGELLIEDETLNSYVTLRQQLRQMLNNHGVPSNPAVSNDWIAAAISQMLKPMVESH